VALRMFRMVHDSPYQYTSDDVIFTVYADRQRIPAKARTAARLAFFSKPQACLRGSDLAKRYGWGIHSDSQGRIALYGIDSDEYRRLAHGKDFIGRSVAVKAAMRSRR
jgi:hypothetical protein